MSAKPAPCPRVRWSAATRSSRNWRRRLRRGSPRGPWWRSRSTCPSSLAERSPGELTPRVKLEKQPLYGLGLKSFFFEEGALRRSATERRLGAQLLPRERKPVIHGDELPAGDTLQDFIVTARDPSSATKVFRESTIRSLFDEIPRACASCTSTRCCTWTSSRPTSSSPTTTRR